jgi:hypothetical protein
LERNKLILVAAGGVILLTTLVFEYRHFLHTFHFASPPANVASLGTEDTSGAVVLSPSEQAELFKLQAARKGARTDAQWQAANNALQDWRRQRSTAVAQGPR